jgi:hypothetical protein
MPEGMPRVGAGDRLRLCLAFALVGRVVCFEKGKTIMPAVLK